MIEVLKKMVEALEWCHGGEPIGTAEAIEAGKQAIAQLESQEPVGEVDAIGLNETDFHVSFKRSMPLGTKLYVHPPQRTWVGLASEDRLTAKYMQDAPDGIEAVIDYIESKLKELNT